MDTVVYWCSVLLGFFITVAVAVTFLFTLSSAFHLFVLPVGVAVGAALGVCVMQTTYKLWQAFWIAAELKERVSNVALQ